MCDEILWNSAALNALKRDQLRALCKRYELKAAGKNAILVARLQEYASSLPTGFQNTFTLPTPSSTLRSRDHPFSDGASSTGDFQERPHQAESDERSHKSRLSDNWDVLSVGGASLISPAKEGIIKSDSVSSWKSAKNGEAMNEFGVAPSRTGSVNSVKALASSLKRTASRTLLSRSSRLTHIAKEVGTEPEHEIVERVTSVPPSPASTVGIARRHSVISLLERPATIRLVASPPPQAQDDECDDLPLFGHARNIHGTSIGQRRSMAPIRSSIHSGDNLGRKSMPALPRTNSASIPSIYPPLPFSAAIDPTSARLPGAFPSTTPAPTSPQFIFGNSAGTTNAQFSEAGRAILQEMNAKLQGRGIALGEELLRGKKAEVEKLVNTNVEVGSGSGTGGWGLGSLSRGKKDRFAEAHEREFAKMQPLSNSISKPQTKRKLSAQERDQSQEEMVPVPSAPNGLPLVPNDDERGAKRKRLSTSATSYLGGLKEAGRSLANLLTDVSPEKAKAPIKVKTQRRRSSNIKATPGRALSTRFGFLKNMRRTPAKAPSSIEITKPVLPTPTMPRKTSVYAPRDPPQPKRPFDLQASLKRGTSRHPSADLTSTLGSTTSMITSTTKGLSQGKDRHPSTSAVNTLSMSARLPLPTFPGSDFAPSLPRSTSAYALGSKNSSISSSKKLSQVEAIRNARPAPPPPSGSDSALNHSKSSLHLSAGPGAGATLSRSSTLYAPTASSLARMQATVKPGPRPLPRPPRPTTSGVNTFIFPSNSTSRPAGSTSTSSNVKVDLHLTDDPAQTPLKENNTNVLSPSKQTTVPTPLKSKTKTKSSTSLAARHRARDKLTGLNVIKSKSDLRDGREVKERQGMIREKQERVKAERELRGLLESGVEIL